jgi:hypothetical protein
MIRVKLDNSRHCYGRFCYTILVSSCLKCESCSAWYCYRCSRDPNMCPCIIDENCKVCTRPVVEKGYTTRTGTSHHCYADSPICEECQEYSCNTCKGSVCQYCYKLTCKKCVCQACTTIKESILFDCMISPLYDKNISNIIIGY